MAVENASIEPIFVVAFIFAAPVMFNTYFKVFRRCGGVDNWFSSHVAATLASGVAVALYFVVVFTGIVVGMVVWETLS